MSTSSFTGSKASKATNVNLEEKCTSQNQIEVKQTVVDGCPVLPKLQCHEVQSGQDARLLWQFKAADGSFIDLQNCQGCVDSRSESLEEDFDAIGTPDCSVQLRMREISGYSELDVIHCIDVDILNSAEGKVRAASIPEEIIRAPGVYLEEWGIFTSDKRMLYSNQCCTFVRRGLFGLSSDTSKRNLGPPSIEEIRLALRDNSAADNLLLDDLEFDAAEISQAVLRPIQFWNEIPPPIRPMQTTKTFPFKEMWMLGIQSYLLELAAHHYRRNQLSYSAGGVSVDDKNKEQYYARTAEHMRQRFEEMVRAKKIEINISSFSGSVSSAYSGLFH